VAHGGLSGPRGDVALAEQRAERVPHGVDVDGPAAGVLLRDVGKPEVAVQDPDQPSRDDKQRRIGRQDLGRWLAAPKGLALRDVKLLGQPVTDVGDQIRP